MAAEGPHPLYYDVTSIQPSGPTGASIAQLDNGQTTTAKRLKDPDGSESSHQGHSAASDHPSVDRQGSESHHIKVSPARHVSPLSSSHSSSFSSQQSQLGLNAHQHSQRSERRSTSRQACRGSRPTFLVEEIGDGDGGCYSDLEIIRPDQYEEADSDWAQSENSRSSSIRGFERRTGIVSDFQEMRLGGSRAREERSRRHRQKKFGIFKRSHSQSIENDIEGKDSAASDMQGIGPGARRLRRRVQGPRNQSSLDADERGSNIVVSDDEEPEFTANMIVDSVPHATEDGQVGSSPVSSESDVMDLS
ncbi:MAG: hypothetical protein M1837_006228 [Sclerophora amabilis]|nr:MAG: hypothetical protein M1837_006228 [Sclerophora amabilis]